MDLRRTLARGLCLWQETINLDGLAENTKHLPTRFHKHQALFNEPISPAPTNISTAIRSYGFISACTLTTRIIWSFSTLNHFLLPSWFKRARKEASGCSTGGNSDSKFLCSIESWNVKDFILLCPLIIISSHQQWRCFGNTSLQYLGATELSVEWAKPANHLKTAKEICHLKVVQLSDLLLTTLTIAKRLVSTISFSVIDKTHTRF